MPPTDEARAGAGPYREARLSSPRPPSRARWAAGLGGALVALGALGVVAARRPAPAPAGRIGRALSLAGGARITAVFADRDARHPEVLRVPGERRRWGVDVVAAPEVLAGNGAVTAASDGEHFVDARGELLRVQEGVVRPLPGVEVALSLPTKPLLAAWAVRRARRFARTGDGELVILPEAQGAPPPLPALYGPVADVATDGASACVLVADRVLCSAAMHAGRGDPPYVMMWGDVGSVWWDVPALAALPAEQVAVAGRVVCARDRAGAVSCASSDLDAERRALWSSSARLAVMGDAPRATALALSRDDLCLLGAGGALWCVHGPQDDATRPLEETPLLLHRAMEGVAEVGLTDGLGCARRGGHIDCWGRLARSGWVVAREGPVRMDDLRGVTELVARRGVVCARSEGEVDCWGVGSSGDAHPQPVEMASGGVDRVVVRGNCFCAVRGGDLACWFDVSHAGAPARADDCGSAPGSPPPTLLDSSWGRLPVVEAAGRRCVAMPSGEVHCGLVDPDSADRFPETPVAGLHEVAQVVMTDDGLVCARRRAGDVWCWGDNRSGALTAAEAESAPRVVTLRR